MSAWKLPSTTCTANPGVLIEWNWPKDFSLFVYSEFADAKHDDDKDIDLLKGLINSAGGMDNINSMSNSPPPNAGGGRVGAPGPIGQPGKVSSFQTYKLNDARTESP